MSLLKLSSWSCVVWGVLEQEVHMEARNLLSITLNGLTSFKCVDQYDPSPPEARSDPADGTLQFDAWLTPRFGDLDAAVRPPQWYVPSEAEVRLRTSSSFQ